MSRIAEMLRPEDYQGGTWNTEGREIEVKEPERMETPYMLPDENIVRRPKQTIKVSRKSLTMQQYARFLKTEYPGLNVGRQRLFNWFRQEGVMGHDSRTPDWPYIRDGLFEVKTVQTTSPNVFEPVTMISPKGQLMFTAAIVRGMTKPEKRLA